MVSLMVKDKEFIEIIKHFNRRLAEKNILHLRMIANDDLEDSPGEFWYDLPKSVTGRDMTVILNYYTHPIFKPEGVFITPKLFLPNDFLAQGIYRPSPHNKFDEEFNSGEYEPKKLDSLLAATPRMDLIGLSGQVYVQNPGSPLGVLVNFCFDSKKIGLCHDQMKSKSYSEGIKRISNPRTAFDYALKIYNS